MEDFDALRREATKLERHLEDKVARYQQLTQRVSSASSNDTISIMEAGGSSSEEVVLRQEIERGLQQLKDLISMKLAPTAERSGKSQQALLVKRYREILLDLTGDFTKSSQNYQRKRRHQELLMGAASSNNSSDDPAMDQLLRERTSIQNSMNASSQIIHQATDVYGDLRQQGSGLRGVSGRMSSIASKIPTVNRLVESIRRKRSRDDYIVAGTIATCILVTLWYIFG